MDKKVSPRIAEMDFRTRESINILRGNIQMAGARIKVIAFTSADENEGKTSLSFLTARSLAALNKKVLFIDCDIRNSRLKQHYQITEKTQGLSEYLCAFCGIDDIIIGTDEEYFDIIFSGKNAPNPSELLSEELFTDLLSKVRKEYDYVIVDTPPAGIVVDASLVCQQCDTTILVVRAFHTDRNEVLKVKKAFEKSGINIMGVALNQTDNRKKHYGRYGYGHYGYGKFGYGQENGKK